LGISPKPGESSNSVAISSARSEIASSRIESSGDKVKIISSFPITGNAVGETQSIILAIKQALDETPSTICNGKLKIEYQILNDNSLTSDSWEDPAQVVSNANRAVADKSVVAFIGPYNSGAAKLVIPILNQSNLLVISPSTTYPGLTKRGKGEGKEPDIYYPNGIRNYARTTPADDIQGEVSADWAKALGVQKIYILDDQGLYGRGVANVFEATARKNGLQILGREGIDSKSTNYRVLMQKIMALKPNMIYFGGIIQQNNAGQLIKDMRRVGMTADKVKFMGADGILKQAFIDAGGEAANGTYATGGIPAKELTGMGKDWYYRYKAKFNTEPEVFAAYGYEAAKVVIAAISKVCTTDRAAIRDTVMYTKNYHGVLGTWSFNQNGDTTLRKIWRCCMKRGCGG
jgi:branched-chain amino acid transport system substrate-binding protein